MLNCDGKFHCYEHMFGCYFFICDCSGYGRLGPECRQHSGCRYSRARPSGATPVLVAPNGVVQLSHRNPRPSRARRSGATKSVGFHYSLITILIANTPELLFGQEVLHGDLQYLHYYLVDMHKLSFKI
jgi:hypothetical protein